jgi:hypothetical protein
LSSCGRRRYAFLQIFKVLGLLPSFDPFEGSNPSELSHDFESFRKLLLALLAADLQTPSSVELPLTLRTPAAAVSQQIIQVTKPETSTQPAHTLHGSCAQLHF